MKPTLANVRKVAALHGANIDIDTGGRGINIDLPAGRAWACNGEHTVCAYACLDEPIRHVYNDVLERMAEGTQDCDDAGCEWCHPAPAE